MKILKRTLSLLVVLSMLFTSGIVEAVAASIPEQEETRAPKRTTISLVDVSDLFVMEEEPVIPQTTPDTQPTEPAEETVETVHRPVENAASVTGTAENFTYEVLENNECSVTGYTGEVGQILEVPETLDGYTVTAIGYRALKGLTMTEVKLPDTIKSFGAGAFRDCSSLSEVTYPVSLETVDSSYGSGLFAGCTALRSVTVPEGVTALPANVFSHAENLTAVSLPSTLKTIGNSAFSESGIETLVLPDGVTAIGDYAFENCTALTSISLGKSLERIGFHAFYGCTGLTELVLPATVKSIGSSAFANCSSLSEFTYPVSLETVDSSYGSGIFSGTVLTSVTVPEGVTALPANMFSYAKTLETVSLPSTLKTIGGNAFDNSGIKSLVLPDGVTAIGNYAFENCTALTSISLGKSLERIGFHAFYGCTGLTELKLPDTVKHIGASAFENCSSLSEVNYPVSLETVDSSYGSGIFSGTALESITVPEGVTALPANVFSHATTLKAVSLPSTLTSIGNSAFSESGIGSVILADGVTAIGSYAFENCTALDRISLGESLTHVGFRAFAGCAGLTELRLPATVQTIEGYAFSGCTGLTQMQLPEALTSIGSAAFEYCTALETVLFCDGIETLPSSIFKGCTALQSVHLPRKLTWISNNAFENCTLLAELYVPGTVSYIHEIAFTGASGVTFLCSLESYAAEFALDHQIPIVPTRLEGEAPKSRLNTENSYYIHNYDGVSAAGVMSMVVRYELQENAGVTPKAITIHVYDYAALQEDTLLLNGTLCTNYEYDEETGRLTIPVTGNSGILRFCLKPLRYEALTSYARLICTDGKAETIEIIGSVNALMPVLNISARAETAKSSVDVSGLAIPGTEVKLFVDGNRVDTVTANKVGDYAAALPLGDPTDGKTYVITAEALDRSGQKAVAQTKVTYRKTTPELVEFVMIHNGRRLTLSEMQTTRPVVSFRQSPFRFEIGLTSPEVLEHVFVVSTRNNVKKYLPAYWDEELELFVAEGYFDPNDHGYVPGVLEIEYAAEGETVSFTQSVDFTSEEAYSALPDAWKNAQVDVKKQTENELSADITFDYNDEDVTLQFSAVSGSIPSYLTEENAESYGYVRYTDDYDHTVYIRKAHNRDQEMADKYSSFKVVDFANKSIEEFAFSMAGAVLEVGSIMDYKDISEALVSGMQTTTDIMYLQSVCASNPNLTAEQKRQFNESANEAMEFAIVSTMTKCSFTVLAAYCGAAAIAGPMGIGAAVVLGVTTFVAGKILDLAMELRMCDLYAKAYGTKFKVKWAIDPSGYVYDKVTGKRISGVTVHAYWIENPGDDPNFWQNKPGADQQGTLWASMEYSQMNPLLTDDDGKYAWDVPEGWWRVSYQKEGYETTWSEWLPVPPPQTEVNIGMMPVGGVLGDFDGDHQVTDADVIYLLWYTVFPEDYPISGHADFDGDNQVTDADVIYLLWHTVFPEDYPLYQ